MRSFLLIVNERARGGNVLSRLDAELRLEPLLSADTALATFVDDAGVLQGLRRLGDERIPVAVGGDGTVTSVARLLRQEGVTDRPMGVLPLGTGNGLTHSLGITNPREAAQALTHGEPRDVDVMTTTHPDWPLSLLNVSVGVEALVMEDFERWRRRSRVVGALVGTGRRVMRTVRGVTIDADGERVVSPEDRFYNAGLYNMPCYGFGVKPKPAADPADGFADLRIHRHRSGYWGYMSAATLRSANPLNAHPAWTRVKRATIATDLPVQMDGESLPPATFDVEVVPGGLTVLAPATS